MIVEHISYDQTEQTYDSSIFTAEKGSGDFAKAYRAKKHIQDYMPAELCNAISGRLQLQSARVSYVEPISQRSRHAKQAVLFVEMNLVLQE